MPESTTHGHHVPPTQPADPPASGDACAADHIADPTIRLAERCKDIIVPIIAAAATALTAAAAAITAIKQ